MHRADPPSAPPLPERPRERLRAVGARNLALRELLALIVGTGGSRGSALAVADRLVAAVDGSLPRLASLDVAALERVAGVGTATACRLLASLELGRRSAVEDGGPGDHVRGPADVFARMGPRLRDVPQEEFHALLLNSRHRVVREVLVTRGTLDSSLIHPREVFRPAVGEGAAAVILVHNHPSGDPTPSPEDRAVTRQLAEAGRAVGIPVLDHVVVGRGAYVSLAGDLPGGSVLSRVP
ncbi:MAG TPA: DNA repair protein RadC [Longimicrobiales bacterium]|nr:DNA repair protein RadC [Longimicrobiales bacterium]